MNIQLAGKTVALDNSMIIGKGGEADIYRISKDTALKLFKTPDHPDFAANPVEQQGASSRLKEHQTKLRDFPRFLPSRVIVPLELAQSGGTVAGYSMRLVQGGEILMNFFKPLHKNSVSDRNSVSVLFKKIHATVCELHKKNVIIGDFNSMNILVKGLEPYFIDADSYQFGKYFCNVFTCRYADPDLCSLKKSRITLAAPFTRLSDWYAFSVLLMEAMLYVDPYGGKYITSGKKVPHHLRPLHRISIFNSKVRYPKPALPLKVLPDALKNYFTEVFENDLREEFPYSLLESIEWSECKNCGKVHSNQKCPFCSTSKKTSPEIIETGGVMIRNIFNTPGKIIHSNVQNNKIHWLYLYNGIYRREDKSPVIRNQSEKGLAFSISSSRTYLSRNGKLIGLSRGKITETIPVDQFDGKCVFSCNSNTVFWLENGFLYRSGSFGPENIGKTLKNRTRFWVGERFGFGFYQAGFLNVSFVFSTDSPGINDNVKIPLDSRIINPVCVFSNQNCYFMYTTKKDGELLNRCFLIHKNGLVKARAQAHVGDGSWLSSISGKCALGDYLFAPCDDGIARVEKSGNELVQTKIFLDTEPFVTQDARLSASRDGIYVTGSRKIFLLTLK